MDKYDYSNRIIVLNWMNKNNSYPLAVENIAEATKVAAEETKEILKDLVKEGFVAKKRAEYDSRRFVYAAKTLHVGISYSYKDGSGGSSGFHLDTPEDVEEFKMSLRQVVAWGADYVVTPSLF